MLLPIILFVLSLFGSGSGQSCAGAGVGTWAAWSTSSSCADCTTAGIAANGQFKIRLCIPPAGSGCVYSSFSCPGNAYERTWCQETTTEEPTTTTTAAATWSAWSCMCCGGCLTARCTRTCQSSGTTTCSGNPVKEDPLTSCTAPSPVCKFPLATCCDGRVPYVNATARARWCN